MRAWLLLGRQGEDPGGLRLLLRQLAESPAHAAWRLEFRPLAADLLGHLQAHRPDVVVLHCGLNVPRSGLEEILALDVGILLAVAEERAEAFGDLAERQALLLTSPQPTLEMLSLGLRNASAALRRQRNWRTQVEQLNQRLNDRIVIERAKGVMVQRLGICEEEAYKRLRLLSRCQRRQIRDIAQSLLDTQALLLPESNGHPEAARGDLKDLYQAAAPPEQARPPQEGE